MSSDTLSMFAWVVLVLVFFATSAIGVVTGSNSLIAVPVMFQFNIAPKTAIATNMFGLTFMAIGGTLPFLKSGALDRKRLPLLALLTVFGSILGACLVGLITDRAISLIVSISMIFMTVFTLFNRKTGVVKREGLTAAAAYTALGLTFVLGIYGGLFSGGYVTMLTAVFVTFLGMTFTEAIANTKLVNIFSSLVATIIFMWQGLVDYKLGLVLGVTMFIAAYAGAKVVTKMNDLWLKRIFFTTVFLLAIKTIFDFVTYKYQ
jgi:uncharacterized membrane protein YfcA